MLYTLTIILIFIVCILTILIVLIQAKGGGLADNFISTSQIMGVRRTADFVEKATWILGISLISLSIIASLSINRETTIQNKSILEEVVNMPGKTDIPTLPTTNIPSE